jgi:hypothetical protein
VLVLRKTSIVEYYYTQGHNASIGIDRLGWIQRQGEYVVYVLELVPQSRNGSYENYIIGPFSSGRISSFTIRPEHVWLS